MATRLRNSSTLDEGKAAKVPQPWRWPLLLLLSMRPWQWTKNLVILAPFIFTVDEWWLPADLAAAARLLQESLAALAIFCGLSGVVYLFNDMADLEKDRLHPRKRRRPLAAGLVPAPLAAATALVVAPLALGGAFLLSAPLGVVALLYLSLNLGYSFALKHVVLLDVLLVASGYVLRLAAGSIVIQEATSPWLYLTIGLGALLLASGKRHSELARAQDAASSQRPVLEQYPPQFTGQLMTISATATVLAYALHTFTGESVPANHSLMLSIPFVVFGVLRYLYLVNVKGDGESPEQLILKDVHLAVAIVAWLLTVVSILVWS